MTLPQPFIERVTGELGETEAQMLFVALDGESPTSVRMNPYKVKEPATLRPIGWSRYGYYLEERPQFTLDSDFHAGAYYVQEASSQFVGHILSQRDIEGCRILDLCAAPGGKTTLYSTMVGLEGLVVANEINRTRSFVLADNIRKWGLGNVVVCNNRTEHIAQIESHFDVVAVDAPCSGEGMFRKADIAREEWSTSNVELCAQRQKEILRDAWCSLKGGGTLIYSTCTFNHSENEEVVEYLSELFDGEIEAYATVDCDDSWGVVKGQVGEFQTFRFYPHRAEGEGFFVAVATKCSDSAKRGRVPKMRKKIFSTLDRASLDLVRRYVEQPELMSFYTVADSTIYGYYSVHAEFIKVLAESLTVIYAGVAMGQIFKGKLKPDGALALFQGLRRESFEVVTLDNSNILLYLRKQDISPSLFAEGINLVCAGDHALGFVKRMGGRVNNLYPNSLRILM